MVFPLRTNAIAFTFPLVTVCLILLNCGVFLIEFVYPGGPLAFIEVWGLNPERLWSNGQIADTGLSAWFTLFTPVFVHFDVMHLLGNMIGIWIFGPALEWLCGRFRFLLLYLGAGLLASLVAASLGSGSTEAGAGASGALAGLMAAFLLIYPRAKVVSWCFLSLVNLFVLSLLPVIRSISVYWYVGFWLVVEMINSWVLIAVGVEGPAGAYAHVGGAIGGGLLVWSLLIADRRPEPDHHTQTGDLTTMIIGEEGDAAAVPLSAEEEALVYLHSPQGRLEAKIRALRAPFKDTLVDSLLTEGQLAAARQHVEEMLELARRDLNPARIEAYEMLLGEINQREAEERESVAAAERAEKVRAVLTAPSQTGKRSSASPSSYGVDDSVGRGTRR